MGRIMKSANCIVLHADGRVLCVSRGVGSNVWGLPGGHVEQGEQPIPTAERELEEETGIVPVQLTKVCVLATPSGGLAATYFVDQRLRGRPRPSEEGDVAWKPWRALMVKGDPYAGYHRSLLGEFNDFMRKVS
jgi:8-oxo-dGTP pyrophosphatase MutT (NUDIX family)